MASLYKKPVTRTDPRTGERVKGKSKKWWGRYRAADGREKRVPLSSDKTAAQAMLNDILRKVEREMAGLTDPFEEHVKKPLLSHVTDYRRHLESKGNADTHVQQTESYIKKIVTECKFKTIRDISASRVATWLSDLRESGKSVRTSNAYLTAIKAFNTWMVRDRRVADNALAHLAALNVSTDVRRERRTLEPAEIAKLIAAARDGKPFRALSGPDRVVLYHVALTTGLRAGELASLTPRNFDLETDPPTVTVEAAYSKRRRRDVLPLRPDVAKALREHLTACGCGRGDRIWPGTWSNRASAKMIKKDLVIAGIPYEDADGRVFDFHSLRHQFISDLARCGVHPKEAQALARHSTITLTMDRYTHVGIVDLTAALDRLPSVQLAVESEAAVQRATGTDGKTSQEKVPVLVPRGAENGAGRAASGMLRIASLCTDEADTGDERGRLKNAKSPDKTGASGDDSHQVSSDDIKRRAWDSNPQLVNERLISNQVPSQFGYPPDGVVPIVGPFRG